MTMTYAKKFWLFVLLYGLVLHYLVGMDGSNILKMFMLTGVIYLLGGHTIHEDRRLTR